MTKKSHQKFLTLKWEFFPKILIGKFSSAKKFSVPSISAPSLRLWITVLLKSLD